MLIEMLKDENLPKEFREVLSVKRKVRCGMSQYNEGQKYDVDVIKMIRNNNLVIDNEDVMQKGQVYFMLDYFDVMFHRSLRGEEKVYRKFWNIESEMTQDELAYKAAYKTLSLYALKEAEETDIWACGEDECSHIPFLGIIQINIVHYIYMEKLEVEKTLDELECRIKESLEQLIVSYTNLKYRIYRSSTSSDFCLIIKNDCIENIFKISTFINNMVVSNGKNNFDFNTYTNIGIECARDVNNNFCTVSNAIVEKNSDCKFVVRFTASNEFAEKAYKSIKENQQYDFTDHMSGLFGRYDFSMTLSMEEFAQIYPTLCESKIGGRTSEKRVEAKSSCVKLLQQEIANGEIQIVNERVLVPLINGEEQDDIKENVNKKETLNEDKNNLRKIVKNNNEQIREKMQQLQNLEGTFIKERRAFIDVTRELKEMINTYVPQGLDHDSHVNWQILISDIDVLFACISKWEKSYENLSSETSRRKSRKHFLSDLRLVVEAINQYYKFIQNVNMQTWQSPLYEIQTQLDAEKLMIAYREFLYEYFCKYKNLMCGTEATHGKIPMFYPIVYPDASIRSACVASPFKQVEGDKKLLVCRVPSFEYYGRMFDMIPWLLHEASHSVRTMKREERNEYLAKRIFYSIFEQAMYKVLNQYTNDFGYHTLGSLEKGVLNEIVKKAWELFGEEKKQEVGKLGIYDLQTEITRFLKCYFDKGDSLKEREERGENEENRKAILTQLCSYYAELNLLREDSLGEIESCLESSGDISTVLEKIYNGFYTQIWQENPQKEQWKLLKLDSDRFEQQLEQQAQQLQLQLQADENQIRDFCFKMREINRLYDTWIKRGSVEKKAQQEGKLWKECIVNIRKRLRDGFGHNEGFTEIYRILNMIFGAGGVASSEDVKRVRKMFNVLSEEELYELVGREVSIYRETCADIYMVATLGLNAFGYCRQMFQTVSDNSVTDNMGWEEAINTHRFRVVITVLTKEEEEAKEGKVLANHLCECGRRYCHAMLSYLEGQLLRDYDTADDEEMCKKIVKDFVLVLRKNIDTLHNKMSCEGVAKALDNSVLAMYAQGDAWEQQENLVPSQKVNEIKERYIKIRDKIKDYKHILYRIQYFMYALSLTVGKGEIYVDEDEFNHMKGLYTGYRTQIDRENRYAVVANFYNDPETAASKSKQSMLDDTISFVEKYYYKNRFDIMSSDEIREEVKSIEKNK